MKEIKVARAIILNENGEVLLGERAQGPGANLMELPGGKVDPGETPEIAVVREVREEVGVKFTPEGLFLQLDEKGQQRDILWKNFYYYGRAEGAIQPDLEEVLSAGFYSKKEITLFEMPFNQKVHLFAFFEKQKLGKI